jgi:hypothetical protein
MSKWIASLFGITLLAACGWQPPPPPPIPDELAKLPVRVMTIGCTPEDRPLGIVDAFEYPSLPADDNSPSVIKGDVLFVMPYCESVTVTELYWSPAPSTQRYFVRIRLDDGRKGWVYLSDVRIAP